MTDRERVIKGLECHMDPCAPCAGCPYNDSNRDCAYSLCEDALNLLKEQQETISSFQGTIRKLTAALEEQPDIVRCKDCKHYMTIHCTCDGCCISDDWYCADGERRDDDD